MNDQNNSVRDRLISLPVAINIPVTYAFITVGACRRVHACVWDVVEGAIQLNSVIWHCVDDEVEKP